MEIEETKKWVNKEEIDEETKREKDANLIITRSCFFTTHKESEKLEISNEQNQSFFHNHLLINFFQFKACNMHLSYLKYM